MGLVRLKLENTIKNYEEERPEAFKAAQSINQQLKSHRVVCVSAETQMGKTTICKILSTIRMLELNDSDLMKLDYKIIAYVENVANNDLVKQAQADFAPLKSHVTVMAITRADEEHFGALPSGNGILFIIDESHMGCDQLAKRLNSVLSQIESRSNPNDRVLLVSATGFSSLYEVANEKSVMGYEAALTVVNPSPAYYGMTKFLENNQVIDNGEAPCLLDAKTVNHPAYSLFISKLKQPGGGVYIVRSASLKTDDTKHHLLSLRDQNGDKLLTEQNVRIVASGLADVDKKELVSWDEVKEEYDIYKDRGQKVVVIVRGYLRVGIAMPPEFKDDLVATWDGTSSAVSSVVQSLVGRACGYHSNTKALHFASKKMISAHDKLTRKLMDFSSKDHIKLNDIAMSIQDITEEFGIKNWDAGLAGADNSRRGNLLAKKKREPQYSVSSWTAYSFDPNTKLKADDYEIDQLLSNLVLNSDVTYEKEHERLSQLISEVHEQYKAKRGGIIPFKPYRRISLPHVYGQYINNKTFTNSRHGQRKKLEEAMSMVNNDQVYSFNTLKTQGKGAKKIENVHYIAFAISTYNAAQVADEAEKENSRIPQESLDRFCKAYGIEPNNTVIVLFKRSLVPSDELSQQIKLNLEASEKVEVDGNLRKNGIYGKKPPSTVL